MKFSLSWLRELAPAAASAPASEVASRLTSAGFHVEGIETVGTDTVLDVDVTTNRVDAMNHRGLARELAALWRGSLQPAAVRLPAEREPIADSLVTIAAPQLCRRYVGLVLRGARVAPSPDWLRARLEAIGLRSINNVVDVTNLVNWESGQPLHAFDLATLRGGRIIVREASEGETLQTLDGEKRTLSAGMVVIADAERSIALGGIMGGLDTEVTDQTRDVLLEAGWFDPLSVRKTSKRLGMHTDASHRFERGVDPTGTLAGAERAAALLLEMGAIATVSAPVDARGEELPALTPIPYSAARLAAFAGVEIPPVEIERLLSALGFELVAAVAPSPGAHWNVTVPPWRRFDVLEEADLHEEVLRLFGFDAIPPTLPAVGGPDAPELPGHRLRRIAKEHLAAAGFAEAIDWAFYGAAEDARFEPFGAPGEPLALVNPLSERHALMRRSLLPGLLESAAFNRRRNQPAVRLFEVGHVFWRGADGSPCESEHLALVAGGQLGNPWQRPRPLDLFDLKGAVESLAALFSRRIEARAAEVKGLAAGRAARLFALDADGLGEGRPVGILGQVDDAEGSFPLFAAEIALEAFLPLPAPATVVPPSRFPGVEVDLTLTHASTVAWAEIEAAVERQRPAELVGFALENRYQGQGVPEGAVNTTIHFVYNAADRSLTQEEVNARHQALAGSLQQQLGWTPTAQAGGASAGAES